MRKATKDDLKTGTKFYRKVGSKKNPVYEFSYEIDGRHTAGVKEKFLGAKWRNRKRIAYKDEPIADYQERHRIMIKIATDNLDQYYVET